MDFSNLPPPLPTADLREWLLWLLRRRQRFRVAGDSMLPTLHAGDIVFGDSHAYRMRAPQPGEIVVARHPQRPDLWVIKRLGGQTDTGDYLLASDNRDAGTDSRSFGPVGRAQLVARVTSKAG